MSSKAASQSSPQTPMQKPERLRASHAKKLMIAFLEKYPIVEAACNKIGISRSTHYEWMKKDTAYRTKIEKAIEASIGTVNDIAESNIINGVKKDEFKATRFWLTHRHPAFRNKTETTTIPEGYIKQHVLSPKAKADLDRSIGFALKGLECHRPHSDETDED